MPTPIASLSRNSLELPVAVQPQSDATSARLLKGERQQIRKVWHEVFIQDAGRLFSSQFAEVIVSQTGSTLGRHGARGMKRHDSEDLIHGMSRHFFGVMLIVATLLLVDQAVLQPLLIRLNGLGPVINLAGRQRMLSQRITKAVLAMSLLPTDAELWQQELAQSLTDWQSVHQGLQMGNRKLGLPGTSDPKILNAFATLEPHYAALASAAKVALEHPEQSTQLAATMLQHEDDYLAKMDQIVKLFEQRATGQVKVLRWLGLLLTLSILGAMAALARLVIRPASEHIRQQWQQLETSERQFRSLVERMHDGLAILDADRRIVYANQRFAAILQREPRELTQQSLLDLVHPEFQTVLSQALSDRSAENAALEIGWQVPGQRCVTLMAPGRYSGPLEYQFSQFVIIADITPQKLAEEKLCEARNVLEDRVAERTRELSHANADLAHEVNERRAIEAQTRTLQSQLAHATRITSLGQLATGIAHEINQPLGAIATFSDTLKLMLGKPETQQADLVQTAERIRNAALRAGQIVSRMRSFLKSQTADKSAVRVNSLIREVLELCSNELRSGRVEVELDIEESEETEVCVDSIQIQQVLLNLVQNSVQAMSSVTDRPRRLSIQAVCHPETVEIVVEDNGHGFPEEWLDSGMKSFRTTKHEGLGMGLSISQSLIQAHHGELRIENLTPHGARVTFILPVEQHDVADSLCRG